MESRNFSTHKMENYEFFNKLTNRIFHVGVWSAYAYIWFIWIEEKKSKLKINFIVHILETIDLHRAICQNEREHQREIDVLKAKWT